VEFYLPQEDALERLESAYDHPADEQIVQQIREIAEQDGKDPQLDEIIMVSLLHGTRTDRRTPTTIASGRTSLLLKKGRSRNYWLPLSRMREAMKSGRPSGGRVPCTNLFPCGRS
jgi:hypothetical protein